MQERAVLLSAERRQAILDRLGRDGKVVAAVLVDELGVSEDTVRRDLRELAAQGLVRRVHGGALPPARPAASFAARRGEVSEEKAALARAAVALLGDARVLLLDGSTTNLELACRLPAEPARTVITNSPPIAAVLAEHPSAEVVMIGGQLDKRAQVTVGAAAVDFLAGVRADVCVLGVCAIDPVAGVRADDLEEAHVKRALAAAAPTLMALATIEKLFGGGAYAVAPIEAVTHLVVEPEAPHDLVERFGAAGVAVTRA